MGARVGKKVGSVLDNAVGMDVVGASVAFVFVVTVGELLGICVGVSVGCRDVGTAVNKLVVGGTVGENVGTVVGNAVGMDVVGVSVVFVLMVIVGELLSICVGICVG